MLEDYKNSPEFVEAFEKFIAWSKYIAENKMLNVADDKIIDALVQNGIEKETAMSAVNEANSHPYIKAGEWLGQRLKKLEALLDTYSTLHAIFPDNSKIERRSNVSREEFLEKYYITNRPVILTDLMTDWRATSLWSCDYFKEKYGEIEVEVMMDRDSNPNYEIECQNHTKTVLLKDYVEMIENNPESNDFYMVANNRALEVEAMKSLLKDIKIPSRYLDTEDTFQKIHLWFGPAGTITHLHHDHVNICLAQVKGRKLVKLVPSYQAHLVYNHRGVYSEVDCGNIDYEKYPLFERVNIMETILNPGEILFLPVGWWHYVKSLDISISVSFVKFHFNNYNIMDRPYLRRPESPLNANNGR